MTSARAAVLLAYAAAAGILVYLLAPILTPFLLAALLAYIINPLVERLERWRVPRAAAVTLVFVLFVAFVVVLLLVLVPLVYRQIVGFAGKVPLYLDWVQGALLPRLQEALGEPLPVDFADLRHAVISNWQQIAELVRNAFANLVASSVRFGAWLVNLLLVPVVTFYLLLDWDTVRRNVLGLLPPGTRATVEALAVETDAVLASFLRGQLLVMLALAAIHAIGLMAIGLDLALPIGILSGLVSFIPFMGFIVGIVTAGIAAYLQFQEATALLWVFLVFFGANLIEGYVLSPYLVGSRIGLHPVVVIFAVLAGGALFGFLGVLLAIPAAAALKVWLRYVHQNYVVAPKDAEAPARRLRQGGE
ncbi:MAG TPA: AI-2E family transporter [Burkholderiales bacterium]